MIDHTGVVVSNFEESKEFYRSVLAAIGYELVTEFPASITGHTDVAGFGETGEPDFWLRKGTPNKPPIHIAFRVASREAVDHFYRKAIEAGGRDNGKPGIRAHYHPDYYGAFVLDPDGHNIEAVCHQPVSVYEDGNQRYPTAVIALDTPPRQKPSNYPEPFASRMNGREKRQIGDLFGLSNFGVNLTHLSPGACSALRHAHTQQDEFVYILYGRPVLVTDQGETSMSPGMCAGFKAGTGNAHHLVNRTNVDVLYLEVGDRSTGDSATYPDDDLQAVLGLDRKWQFLHKDGTPY